MPSIVSKHLDARYPSSNDKDIHINAINGQASSLPREPRVRFGSVDVEYVNTYKRYGPREESTDQGEECIDLNPRSPSSAEKFRDLKHHERSEETI